VCQTNGASHQHPFRRSASPCLAIRHGKRPQLVFWHQPGLPARSQRWGRREEFQAYSWSNRRHSAASWEPL